MNSLAQRLQPFKQYGDRLGGIEIVVHAVFQFAAERLRVGRSARARFRLHHRAEHVVQVTETLFGAVQCLLGKVGRAAIVALQQEEADYHGVPGAGEQFVIAAEKFIERDGIAQRFTHLLSAERNHIVVHPVVGKRFVVGAFALGDLAFVVGENIVEAASVNIKVVAEVFGRHHRALDVPARVPPSPR